MLAGCDFVVLGLRINAKLPKFLVQILHKGLDARTDGTKVMILHLLPLGRLGAKERAAGQNQIRTLRIMLLIDQEIFLLGADRGGHTLDILAKEL